MATELFCDFALSLTHTDLCVRLSEKLSLLELRKFLNTKTEALAEEARKLRRQRILIYNPPSDRPFSVPVKMATESSTPDPKLGRDYGAVVESLQQWQADGKIIWIVSNQDDPARGDRVLSVNSLLTAPRSLWTPDKWIGYNYRQSWRLTFDPDDRRLNPQYENLKSLLERDGYAPRYDYTLFRTVDNALVEYQTDYFLCRDYCGIPVRIGISDPAAYRVLETAPV